MDFLKIIERKRDGQELSADEVQELVDACVAGEVPEYQIAAFLMAVFFQGMTAGETKALTLAMRDSGDVLVFPSDPRPVVDKHSTGGIGDKVSLALAPLLAELGFRVPMISGRGLGITGGTLDKLDSIPGFRTQLSKNEIISIVQEVGCVICGQTWNMVPADKVLYALRDVTGTVPSIPLIVGSILSKKIAETPSSLILDVKYGAGTFMPTRDRAEELAYALVTMGNKCGVNTRTILTPMDTPIGHAVGNWLEVKEAVACLQGKGPDDLVQLVVTCAAHLLVLEGKADNLSQAREFAYDTLQSGAALASWERMLAAQGADMEAYRCKLERDSTANTILEVTSPADGFVRECDARLIGEAVRQLGGGRLTKSSTLDLEVGVNRILKPGSRVKPGMTLARIHAASESSAHQAKQLVAEAFKFGMVEPMPIDITDDTYIGLKQRCATAA